MGLGLNGCQIDATYPGLIKTCDNSAVTSTYKPITDGNGNDLPVQVSSLGTKFTGDADFTGATVTGIPAGPTGPTGPTGAPGPTGAQGATGASLTYDLASTQNASDVDVTLTGSDLSVDTVKLVAGTNITLTDSGSNAITIDAAGGGGAAGLVNGTGADSLKNADSLVTTPAAADGTCSIALGNAACATGKDTIAIGNGARATSSCNSITIGLNACDTGLQKGIAIGANTKAGCTGNGSYRGMAIGDAAQGTGTESIAIGLSANTCLYTYGIAIGRGTCTTAQQAIAIGANVSASRACALTTCEIELCTAGGGIYLTTPDGLAQPKLTVDNSCSLLVDGTPVGGGAAGLVNGTGTDSLKNADSLVTNPATASGPSTIALGDGAIASSLCSIAIGKTACATNEFGIAIGQISKAQRGISLGRGAQHDWCDIVIGQGARATNITATSKVVLGNDACATTGGSVVIGGYARGTGDFSTAVGYQSCATAACSIAIGACVTAAKACTLTTCEIELCTAGGGIYLTTPDGLAQPKLTVDNSCALLVDGTPVGGGGGAAGLVNGTGADSLKNADSLVTLPATALGACSIALGDNACVVQECGIAIGIGSIAQGGRGINIGANSTSQSSVNQNTAVGAKTYVGAGATAFGTLACASGVNSIAIGAQCNYSFTAASALATQIGSIAIGSCASALQANTVVIGNATVTTLAASGVAIGNGACTSNGEGVAIGSSARSINNRGVAIGRNSCAQGPLGISLGNYSRACGNNAISIGGAGASVSGGALANYAISIGSGNSVSLANAEGSIAIGGNTGDRTNCATGTCAIAIGLDAQSTGISSIAIGPAVIATRANALTTCEIELCTAGGGLYLTTPDGLAQPKISVDNSCALLVDGTPVGGGGGAAGLVSGTGASSMKNADSLVTTPAVAAGICSIALGDTSCAAGEFSISIGQNSKSVRGISLGRGASNDWSDVVIGQSARGVNISSVTKVVLGNNACATTNGAIVLGTYTRGISDFSIALGAYACSNAVCAIAIGACVTATRADALTTCEYVACVAGKGVVVTSPDGLTTLGIGIDNSGNIVTYTP